MINKKPPKPNLKLSKKPKPKKERKPNQAKRDIIQVLNEALTDIADNVTVTNIERQISFELDGETYEVTLVQKRKPKS